MKKPLYVFDMDETLVNLDCAKEWNCFLVDKGVVTTPGFLETDQAMMAQYARGEMSMTAYLEFAIPPLMHLSKAAITALVDECVETRIIPAVFPQALTLIAQLKADRLPMIIISATVTFIVERVAKRLGIEHAIGVELVEKAECYQPIIEGIASYREGKVTRLEAWRSAQSDDYEEVHFYTDSINDLPLCLHADVVRLINPCPRLIAYRDQQDRHDWQVLKWG
ncbi:HAD family hydrolase [Thaumasiovibrio subtropicus]|uniref:HAD family hydrolase n=1 Tax=Thaumasiovibrio subtropicus TaxID=1891207 RepID=UPI000B36342C|nr:HAD family hydrolase [Thaumasiovibrio subtropicus]